MGYDGGAWDTSAVFYHASASKVVSATNVEYTAGNYKWQILRFSDTLAIDADYTYGDTSTNPRNGPKRARLYNDKFGVFGGSITPTGGSTQGALVVIDTADFSAIVDSAAFGTGSRIVDFDFNLGVDSVLTLNMDEQDSGLVSGTGGNPHLYLFGLHTTTGALTSTLNQELIGTSGPYNVCDTLTIISATAFISCTYWENLIAS